MGLILPRSRRRVAAGGGYDYLAGAYAAWSLRGLNGYTGAVVRVERSSDSTQSDFTGGELSDGTLTAWVGSGNTGEVVTIYDQAGTNDLIQSHAGAQIVQAGALVTEGSRPAIYIEGGNLRGAFSTSSSAQAYGTNVSMSFVFRHNPSGSDSASFGAWFSINAGDSNDFNPGRNHVSYSYNTNNSVWTTGRKARLMTRNGTSGRGWENNSSVFNSTIGTGTGFGTFILGGRGAISDASSVEMYFQELVWWKSDMTSDVADIYSDQSTFWNL